LRIPRPQSLTIRWTVHSRCIPVYPKPFQKQSPTVRYINTNTSAIDADTITDMCAAVQTRAMVDKESKPPKPLKVKSVPGLDVGPEA